MGGSMENENENPKDKPNSGENKRTKQNENNQVVVPIEINVRICFSRVEKGYRVGLGIINSLGKNRLFVAGCPLWDGG